MVSLERFFANPPSAILQGCIGRGRTGDRARRVFHYGSASLTEPKLPLWRLLTGIAILGAFVAVLIELAPVYIDNYRLAGYVHGLDTAPASKTAPDDTLRAEVISKARELDLPVRPGDINITHESGKLQVKAAYRVQMDLSLYHVDLHMSAH